MHVDNQRVREIAIVGGGLAAWLSAAALGRAFPNKDVRVRVIETSDEPSPELALGGVATTVPAFRHFLSILGINEAELVGAASGTFQLATEFRDWAQKGEGFLSPHGDIGVALEGVPFHQHWLRMHGLGETSPLSDFSLAATAAKAGKFAPQSHDQSSVLSTHNYALNLDAVLLTQFMRNFALRVGVEAVRGDIDQIHVAADAPRIEAVTLAGGARIEADLYVDCTGADAILVKALSATFEDWSAFLPCDRARSVSGPLRSQVRPLTTIHAARAGWRRSVDLRDRTIHTYVYSSAHASVQDAAALLAETSGASVNASKVVNLHPGRRASTWTGNCVAIGVSAGYLDPLDGASLNLTNSAVLRLIRLFPAQRWPQIEAAEFNRVLGEEYDRARDYQALHYAAAKREDTPFWRARLENTPPETLAHKMRLFESRGRIVMLDEETHPESAWVATFIGHGVTPRRFDPLAENMGMDATRVAMRRMRDTIAKAAASMPPHGEFLERFCPIRPNAGTP